MSFLRLFFVIGLIAFSVYEIVQLVNTIKERKKAKSINKENIKDNDRNSNS